MSLYEYGSPLDLVLILFLGRHADLCQNPHG